MAVKALPSPEVLRQLFRYEPNTGKLFWLPRAANMFKSGATGGAAASAGRWNAARAGKEAMRRIGREGYHVGRVCGVDVLAHRVIVALAEGAWPVQVDHINGDRRDNRVENLRAVSHTVNMRNRKTSTKRDLPMGVYRNRTGTFVAQVHADGRNIHLGTFACSTAARVARVKAQRAFGYHENHGR